jgi:hypothetical protein
MKTAVPAALFLFAAAGAAGAQDDLVGIRGRYWYAQLNGTAESTGGVVPPTVIDLDQELGLNDIEPILELEGWIQIPVLGRISAGYWHGVFSGNRTLSQDISFEDITFTAGTNVSSELDLMVASLSYEFVLPSIPVGDLFAFEIGLLLGIRYLEAEAEVVSAIESVSDSGSGGLPVLGVHVTLLFAELIRLEGQLAGLAFSYSDTATAFVDAFLEATVSFGPFFAGAGYRYITFVLEQQDDPEAYEVDLAIDGFYLTAGVRF